MSNVTLGCTGITTNKNGFGALPIQRVSKEEAVYLLRKARHGGVTYFDTARAYSDSEEKVGAAFAGMRETVFIATKTNATTAAALWEQLGISLARLQTDYIDVYQLHNPPFVPVPGDGSGVYEALLEAKRQGKIRHIAITNHRLPVAEEAVKSGLYELLQFPFSYLSDQREIDLANLCRERNVGFVAMKGLAGGVLNNSAAAYAWMDQYPNVLPIWGVQRESELDEFLSYIGNPPALEAMQGVINADRKALAEDFCRGCAYCSPCPAGIEIHTCARISHLLRRAPSARFLEPAFQGEMAKIDDCIHCGQCASRCPYNLDPPAMLAKNYADYKEILAGKAV